VEEGKPDPAMVTNRHLITHFIGARRKKKGGGKIRRYQALLSMGTRGGGGKNHTKEKEKSVMRQSKCGMVLGFWLWGGGGDCFLGGKMGKGGGSIWVG